MTLAFADKVHNSKSFQQNGLRPYIEQLATYEDDGQLQVVHTPFWLCEDILMKVSEFRNLKNSNILVLFNLEFVDVLLDTFQVKPAKITFAADAETKLEAAKAWGCKTLTVTYSKERGVEIMPEPKKKFDVVVTNPPYQSNSKSRKGTTGGSLWDKCVPTIINVVQEDGLATVVHPAMWRKPDHELLPLITGLNLLYLEMHSERDGRRTFKISKKGKLKDVSTNYDWYVIQKSPSQGETKVVDYNGHKSTRDLRNQPFIPNSLHEEIHRILTTDSDEACEVLYSRSMNATDKKWMQQEQSGRFKHPCVHEMNQEGFGLWYSSRKSSMFVPKVILGVGRHQYPILDDKGEYGITQNCFGIAIKSKREGENIIKAINSDRFKEVIAATKWGAFQTDWRMFKYFRADFWKEFI